MATGAVSDSEELNFIRKVIDEGGVTRAQILVILIALILNMLDGFDVTAMAFTVHGIGQELEIATGQLGIVFSVALAGMMVGAMFLAPVADILGRRKMIIICVSMIGLSMCATGIATTLWELIFYRAITGLGVGDAGKFGGDKRRVHPSEISQPSRHGHHRRLSFWRNPWQLHCRTTDPCLWLGKRVLLVDWRH